MCLFWSNRAEGSNILLDPTQVCKKSRKIPNKILDICKQESRNKTSLLKKITRGISMGFRECETQFRNRRWNCSTQRKSMKKILLRGKLKSFDRRLSIIMPKLIHSIIGYLDIHSINILIGNWWSDVHKDIL